MTSTKQPPDPEALRKLAQVMIKNFESAGRRSVGSRIGVPTMRKGYLKG